MNYTGKTQKELVELCRERGIKANNKMSKAKLAGLLTATSTENACSARYRVATGGGGPLNVRESPDALAPVMGTLPNGSQFRAVPAGKDWLSVDGGYVLADLAAAM